VNFRVVVAAALQQGPQGQVMAATVLCAFGVVGGLKDEDEID